jgi:hypothetical protein
MKKILTGPNGIRLHLDSSKIIPDDPGQDTPAMVEYKGRWGTYDCVADTGVMDHGESTIMVLNTPVHNWLTARLDEVEKMHAAGPDGEW